MSKNITINEAIELFAEARTPMARRKLNLTITFKSPEFGGGRQTCGDLNMISDSSILFSGNNGKTRNKHISRNGMEILQIVNWA